MRAFSLYSLLVIATVCGLLLSCAGAAYAQKESLDSPPKLTKQYLRFEPIARLNALNKQTAIRPNTPSFLIVDLDGDGIDIIPLAQSNVYFDVDGDGLAERTAWIGPDDAVLGVMSRTTYLSTEDTGQRLFDAFVNGISTIRKFDRNSDGIYEEQDYPRYNQQTFRDLGFLIAKDRDLDGIPETHHKQLIKCNFHSFDFRNSEQYILSCDNRSDVYVVRKIQFEYEDSNVLWEALCDRLRQSHSSEAKKEYEERCITRGSDPNDIEREK